MSELLSGELHAAAMLPNVWWGVSVEDRKHGIPRIAHLQNTAVRLRFLSIEPILEDVGSLPLEGIDWVIVGGESGHGARKMEESWVISILHQCQSNGVRFFFKQWGGVMKKRNGRRLLGQTWDDMPLRSAAPMSNTAERRALQAKFDTLAAQFQPDPCIRPAILSRPRGAVSVL